MAPYRDLALTGLAVVASVMIDSGLALPRQNANVSAPVGIPAAAAPQSASESGELAHKPGYLEPVDAGHKPAYLALARYLSRRYRIATESARSVVRGELSVVTEDARCGSTT